MYTLHLHRNEYPTHVLPFEPESSTPIALGIIMGKNKTKQNTMTFKYLMEKKWKKE